MKPTKIFWNTQNHQELFAIDHRDGEIVSTDGGRNWRVLEHLHGSSGGAVDKFSCIDVLAGSAEEIRFLLAGSQVIRNETDLFELISTRKLMDLSLFDWKIEPLPRKAA